jgi:hypothetical protein
MMSTLQARFDAKWKLDPASGCWLWTAYLGIEGYGRLAVEEKRLLAHRVSWLLHKGKISKDKLVLHKCDTRNCVNPEHLFLGNYSDNIRDCYEKGRHPGAKLTAEQILEIRSWTGPARIIAAKFGVHQSRISPIRNGVTQFSGISVSPKQARATNIAKAPAKLQGRPRKAHSNGTEIAVKLFVRPSPLIRIKLVADCSEDGEPSKGWLRANSEVTVRGEPRH